MKRILTLILFALAGTALASIVVLFDPNSQPVPNRVVRILHSADELAYRDRADAIVDVQSIPAAGMLKASNGLVVVFTQAESNLWTWYAESNATWQAAADRTNILNAAAEFVDGLTPESRILRAFALLTLDQINTLRKLHSLPVITTNVFLSAMTNAVKDAPR